MLRKAKSRIAGRRTKTLLTALFAVVIFATIVSGCNKPDDTNQGTCPEKHAGTYKGSVTYFNGTVYSNIDADIRIIGSGSSAKLVLQYYLSPADTIYATMNCSLNTFTIPAQTVGACDFEGYGTISNNGASMTYHISNQGSGCGPVYLDGTFTKL